MPSQFEPCGLSQLIALRYGAVPLVRETGGLRDTVIPYNRFTDEGNGFSFANYNSGEMLFTLKLALKYYEDKPLWQRLTERAMRSDYSWDNSAKEYFTLYMGLMRERKRRVPEEPVPIKKSETAEKASKEEPRTVKESKAAAEGQTGSETKIKIKRKTKTASANQNTGEQKV
jgi:hypothetical protein